MLQIQLHALHGNGLVRRGLGQQNLVDVIDAGSIHNAPADFMAVAVRIVFKLHQELRAAQPLHV